VNESLRGARVGQFVRAVERLALVVFWVAAVQLSGELPSQAGLASGIVLNEALRICAWRLRKRPGAG